jgi:hypothetical protein
MVFHSKIESERYRRKSLNHFCDTTFTKILTREKNSHQKIAKIRNSQWQSGGNGENFQTFFLHFL